MSASEEMSESKDEAPGPVAVKMLTPEAQRALAEAADRQKLRDKEQSAAATEVGGPKGLEPTRFGDWEKGGITSDF
jgi:hypothetical protein